MPPRCGSRSQRGELASGGELDDLCRRGERRDERGQAARQAGMEKIAREHRVRRVGLCFDRRPPRGDRVAARRPQPRQPEVEVHDSALRIELRKLLDSIERAFGPGRERGAHLGFERVVLREHGRRAVQLSLSVERGASREVSCFGVVAKAERQRQRRASRARFGVGSGGGRRASFRRENGTRDDGDRGDGREGDEQDDATPSAHETTIAARIANPRPGSHWPRIATVRKVMASYRELLAQVKEEIDEISSTEAQELLASSEPPLFVDVREPDEWEEGHIPGAVYVTRGRLEQQIEGLVPDKSRPLVVYCSAGSRSAFAAKSLGELGLRGRRQPGGRLRGLEAERVRGDDAACSLVRATRAVQPPPLDPRGRRGRPAAPPGRARAPRRSRWPRLPRVALSGCSRRRHARDRRRGRRRRVEPAAPDRPLHRHAGRAQGALGQAHDRGAEPGRSRQAVRGTSDLRERRSHPRRGLGRDRGRRGQLPDPLPRERRLGLARNPGRPRLDLPLRGPGDGLLSRRGPVLPLPLPPASASRAGAELRRGRRPRRPAGDHRLAAGERGAQADPRTRRDARRPAAPLRCARNDPRRGERASRSVLPGLRRQPHHHRVRRLRGVLLDAGEPQR